MIELLSLLGGAFTRLLPSVMDYFKQGRDLKYEIQRMEADYKLETLRGQNRLSEIQATQNATIEGDWSKALISAIDNQTKPTGDKWLDRLNVSVRPILTYWWCIILYTINKAFLVFVAFTMSHDLVTIASTIFTEFDRTVVGSIIGFWFVDRALRNKK